MAKQIEISEALIGETCQMVHMLIKSFLPGYGIKKDIYRIAKDIAVIGMNTEGGRHLAAWLNDPKIRAEVW